MLVQPRLPLALPMQARARSVRRPFHPALGEGAYRLPNAIRDRLAPSLAPFRNRESRLCPGGLPRAVLVVAWSRIVETFHIDRRALADHGDLDLTEKRIRSAIRGPGGDRVSGSRLAVRLALQADRGRPAPQAHPVPVRQSSMPRCSSRPMGGLRRRVAGMLASAVPSPPKTRRRASAANSEARPLRGPKAKAKRIGL